jgi:hypothetical protein
MKIPETITIKIFTDGNYYLTNQNKQEILCLKSKWK